MAGHPDSAARRFTGRDHRDSPVMTAVLFLTLQPGEPAMAFTRTDAKTKAWVKFHVETTTWTIGEIARRAKIARSTVNLWIVENDWRRPNVTARPVLTPERLKATRLGYEAGMRVADLAVLNGRSQAWVHRLVREQEW